MLHCSPCSISVMANLMCCGDRDRVSVGVEVGVAMFVVVELDKSHTQKVVLGAQTVDVCLLAEEFQGK